MDGWVVFEWLRDKYIMEEITLLLSSMYTNIANLGRTYIYLVTLGRDKGKRERYRTEMTGFYGRASFVKFIYSL